MLGVVSILFPGTGVPASAQYEQNVSIGIRRRRDIIVFHRAPEIAVLNLGSGSPVASRWLRVRDMIAGEPFGVYLSSSRTEKGHQMLRYLLPGTGSAGFVWIRENVE